MATVRKPSSVAARITRMAISLRLATRSFFIVGHPTSGKKDAREYPQTGPPGIAKTWANPRIKKGRQFCRPCGMFDYLNSLEYPPRLPARVPGRAPRGPLLAE